MGGNLSRRGRGRQGNRIGAVSCAILAASPAGEPDGNKSSVPFPPNALTQIFVLSPDTHELVPSPLVVIPFPVQIRFGAKIQNHIFTPQPANGFYQLAVPVYDKASPELPSGLPLPL